MSRYWNSLPHPFLLHCQVPRLGLGPTSGELGGSHFGYFIDHHMINETSSQPNTRKSILGQCVVTKVSLWHVFENYLITWICAKVRRSSFDPFTPRLLADNAFHGRGTKTQPMELCIILCICVPGTCLWNVGCHYCSSHFITPWTCVTHLTGNNAFQLLCHAKGLVCLLI
jgi:hypothetical protein